MKQKSLRFRLKPSTRSFSREARKTPDYTLFDWLDCYILHGSKRKIPFSLLTGASNETRHRY